MYLFLGLHKGLSNYCKCKAFSSPSPRRRIGFSNHYLSIFVSHFCIAESGSTFKDLTEAEFLFKKKHWQVPSLPLSLFLILSVSYYLLLSFLSSALFFQFAYFLILCTSFHPYFPHVPFFPSFCFLSQQSPLFLPFLRFFNFLSLDLCHIFTSSFHP